MNALSRQYVKLCDLRDFDDDELMDVVRNILPERDGEAHKERKVWEFAMLVLFMRELGCLNDAVEALSVGAGDERILFWLANHLGRVVATDIYGEGSFVEREAEGSMLTDPAAHSPFPYREDHLEVLWMDARSLDFPDESFDFVFTLSSIEHFGTPAAIATSARELGRVLRPGGHALIVTECLVRRHPFDAAPVGFLKRLASLNHSFCAATPRRRVSVGDAFTARELRKRIVEPSGLRLMQPLDPALSKESWHNLALLGSDGAVTSRTGTFYPHVLLQASRSVFTSVCLALEKPAL